MNGATPTVHNVLQYTVGESPIQSLPRLPRCPPCLMADLLAQGYHVLHGRVESLDRVCTL